MGAFDRARAADVYGQIDVLVVPSLWLENSPLVIHEAFMAGVPVVGARIGGIADLVEDGETGCLYDPTSPAELRGVLRELIDAPAADETPRGRCRNDPAGEVDRAGRARVGSDLRGRRQRGERSFSQPRDHAVRLDRHADAQRRRDAARRCSTASRASASTCRLRSSRSIRDRPTARRTAAGRRRPR